MTIGQVKQKQDILGALRWRSIGPPRGGRVVAVAGDPWNVTTFYFGACAGGVWKTSDAGIYWENVSDGFFNTAAVGAIAVADSDPNVIYAGTGEACIRGNVSYGDGVYKSTDGGKTWANMGLSDTRHISRIRIHPKDPSLVYVAAFGHAFGPNEERGIFRSKDGGETWEKVLFKSDKAGAADLTFDLTNPRILYATIWQALRTPWSLVSGGPDSGIFKSVDGGDIWTEITNNPGLPKGLKGRMGIAASPAQPGRVWATIEAEDCGVYRSDDGGDTWEMVNDSRDVQARPWYYQHIFADPQDANTVWILSSQCWKSLDGGQAFTWVTTPHDDNHDLWIDPNNPQRMIEGNDGGACVTFNGGQTWSTIYNQPTAQFYHVRADNQFPYRLYGTQQDNSAISVPSRTHKDAIHWSDCYPVGNAESGYIAVHPEDPNIVFSGAIGISPDEGNLLRYDHRTGQVRNVTVWPEFYAGWGAKDMKYRFQWTYPIQFSPHDPNILYVTGNLVFRSRDQGSSWEAISPDLTRNDPTTLELSGGPITIDATGAETYGTIFAFTESLHERGVFWAGSDDGLIHISRDDGKTWDKVTPKGLPEWTLISMIEPSSHDPAAAYIAATRYKLDDPRPILYKTNDYGKTWTNISQGIPGGDYTRVIREDPTRRGLLYVGTETSVYLSFDDGASWQSLQANLPAVPVYDLVIKDNDLLAATHGRSFWILDDVTQIHQVTDDLASKSFHLMKPRDTYRVAGPGKNYQLALGAVAYSETKDLQGQTLRKFLDAGKNPPDGVIVTYYLKDKPSEDEEVLLSFLDSDGQMIKTFSSKKEDGQGSTGPLEVSRVSAEACMNRFIWDMQYSDACKIPDDKSTEQIVIAPLAPPGAYHVVLKVVGQSQTETFDIVKDPRVATTQEDFQAQFDLLIKIRDKVSETNDSVVKLRSVKRQVDEWTRRAAGHSSADAVSEASSILRAKLSVIENDLVQVDFKGERDRFHLPAKLNRKLAELAGVVSSADFAPPKQAYDVLDDFTVRIDSQLERLQEVIDQDVSQFMDMVHEMQIPAIVPTTGD